MSVKQGGVKGFDPKLGGHAKANHANTSGFGAGPPDYTLPGYPSGKETAAPKKKTKGK